MIKEVDEIMKENSILESNRLILRPFSTKDIEDVFSYANDEEVTKYLTWDTHESILETEKVVDELYIGNLGVYAIELKSEKKCIGCIDLRICAEHDKGSFGYVLNKDYWNKGYMSEALETILYFGFIELKLNRIESTHYLGNEGSGRVMKKCGMNYEGTGKQELKFKNIYHDVIHYAILKKDYKKKDS